MAKPTRKTMPPKFWVWFDEKRRAMDLSDTGVAEMARVAQSVISKARNEQRPIGIKSLGKIAVAFNTPFHEVLALAGYPQAGAAIDPVDSEVTRLLAGLNDTQKRAAKNIVAEFVKGLKSAQTESR